MKVRIPSERRRKRHEATENHPRLPQGFPRNLRDPPERKKSRSYPRKAGSFRGCHCAGAQHPIRGRDASRRRSRITKLRLTGQYQGAQAKRQREQHPGFLRRFTGFTIGFTGVLAGCCPRVWCG
eukprot:s24_g43.t1